MKTVAENYKILGIGDVRLRVAEDAEARQTLAQFEGEVDDIWERALRQRKLFNGKLLGFLGLRRNGAAMEVIAHPTEYKYFFAKSQRPTLGFSIYPIAVSGITVLSRESQTYALFAERGKEVSEYPGWLELVPSGSLDGSFIDQDGLVDFRAQLLTELTEETGLAAEDVKKVSGAALVLDTRDSVYDICCKIVVDGEKSAAFEQLRPSAEYRNPIWVSTGQLKDFAAKHAGRIVPASMAIIEVQQKL